MNPSDGSERRPLLPDLGSAVLLEVADRAYRAGGADGARAVDEVTPLIAGAGATKELRALASEMAASELARSSDTVERETMWEAVCWLRERADELQSRLGVSMGEDD